MENQKFKDLGKMEINEEIVAQTKWCTKNYACLKNPAKVICKVVSCVGEQVLFVQFNKDAFCEYQMFFGNSVICNCPVRNEIYNKYNL